MAESSIVAKFASAGNNIKIWRSHDFSVLHQFVFDDAVWFQSVDWSPDSRNLVSMTSKGDKMFLSAIEMEENKLKHATLQMHDKCTTVKYSNTSSRFVGVGTEVGLIHVWDIKYKKSVKSFQTNDEITCLHFNWDDSYIATGSISGSIILHNTVTLQSSAPLVSKNTEGIRSLQYSFLKKNILGSASDDGGVRLWDVHRRHIDHHFSAHFTPATGLCFSPKNEYLLASVGLDKRLNLFDFRGKKTVGSTECAAPLTSIDFKDGFIIAAGSSRGDIYIFDMRNMNKPHLISKAHQTSVHSMAFPRSSKDIISLGKKNCQSESITSGINFTSALGTSDSPRADSMLHVRSKQNLTYELFSPVNASNASLQDKRKQSFFSGLLSPLEDPFQLSSQSRSVTPSKINSDIFSPIKESSNQNDSEKRRNVESDIFFLLKSQENPVILVEDTDDVNGKIPKNKKSSEKEEKTETELHTAKEMAYQNWNQRVSIQHYEGNSIAMAKQRSYSVNCAYENQKHVTTRTERPDNIFPVQYIKDVFNDIAEDYADTLRRHMHIMHVQNCRMNQELKNELQEIRKLFT